MEVLSEYELAALQRQLGTLLLEGDLDGAWTARIQALAELCLSLVERDADALLYLMVQGAQRPQSGYSSRHAMFCAAVADLGARQLGFGDRQRSSLAAAALTMNLSMTQLQDELVDRDRTPTLEQRLSIQHHAKHSSERLRSFGVVDADWLGIVEGHHDEPLAEFTYADLSAGQRLAALLRRVDIFTAKISARRTRSALSPTVAARQACLGTDGRPDVIGSALLKSLGLYPPGSYVRLVNDEWGVVTKRGPRLNAPRVMCLWSGAKPVPREPVARDTSQPEFAVKVSVAGSELRS